MRPGEDSNLRHLAWSEHAGSGCRHTPRRFTGAAHRMGMRNPTRCA